MMRPAHVIRIRKLRATIWQQASDQSAYSVEIRRTYRLNGKWLESRSFYRDDLPLVSKLADMAYAWIYAQEAKETSDNGSLKSP